jgi:hypothetical protein
MFKEEQIANAKVVPALGERWGRPVEEQLAIKISEKSLPAITEKMVRGIVYREDDAFIEPPDKIDFFLVGDGGAKECKELLDQFGEVYKRDPGLEIRRAVLDGGDVYEITFWQQFKTYAPVAKPKAPAQA